MKLIYTVLITIMVTISTYGQSSIGARAGINYSKVNGIGSNEYEFDWVKNYHIGVFVFTKLGEDLYFQPELLYNNRGYYFIKQYVSDRIVSGDTIQLKQKTELNYLDLPILAKLHVGQFYFEAGPQFGVHLNGKNKYVYTLSKNGELSHITTQNHSRNTIEPVDIGFILGLGYQTNTGLGIGFRYNQGFREVVRRVNWEKNVLLQGTVSYIFGYKAFLKYKHESTIPVNSQQDEYFDPNKKAYNSAGYTILTKQNVLRVSVDKVGEAVRSDIQYVFNSVGSHTPSNVVIAGSSGSEVQSPLFIGFRDIEFPFKGTIKYSANSAIGVGTIESFLELEIREPGIWRVNIMTQ